MTTTPDVLALEAEATAAAERLTAAQEAIVTTRERNRQAYLAAVHKLAAEAFDAELANQATARQRKAEALDRIKAAVRVDPVWSAVLDFLAAEHEAQGYVLDDLAANSGGLRQRNRPGGTTASVEATNAFDLLRRIVREARPAVTRGHDALEQILAQARQESGFDHAGTPVVE